MKNKLLPILLLFCFIGAVHPTIAQKLPIVIQGQVLNAENNRPVTNVNVYLSGTTIGTTTNVQGQFTLSDSIPKGNYSLAFSHVNYSLETKPLLIEKNDSLRFDVLLIPKKGDLQVVTISAKKDAIWNKHFKRFKTEFLGTSRAAMKCKILNPWVLDFKENNDTLYASATQPLEIENLALGYKVFCQMTNFNNHGNQTSYLGMYRFELLKPKSSKQAQKWEQQRLRVFHGSFRHLICAILYERIEKDRFEIYATSQSPELHANPELRYVNPNDLYKQTNKGFDITLPNYLKVMYHKEREEMGFINWQNRYKQNNAGHLFKRKPQAQKSWLKVQGNTFSVSSRGVVMSNPDKVNTFGYWSWERVGDMLPLDYLPQEILAAMKLSKIEVVKQLKDYVRLRPQEKVYLHQDKGYYAVGDTIWLAGYVVNAQTHKPSNLSKVLYVEVIDSQNQIKKQLKLYNDKGRATGEVVLNRDYLPGKYRLRAYTRLMTDAPKHLLFNRKFEIGLFSKKQLNARLSYQSSQEGKQERIDYTLALKDHLTQVLAGKSVELQLKAGENEQTQNLKLNAEGKLQGTWQIPATSAPYVELIVRSKSKKSDFSQRFYIPVRRYQTHLSFFPEGGELIAGIANQVAFKAVNPQGRGVAVKGYVVDEKGKQVAEFQSQHLGMGKFEFTPKKGKRYIAMIRQAQGAVQSVALPASLGQGYNIVLKHLSKTKLQLKVQTSERRKQAIVVIGHSRGVPVYSVSGVVKKRNPFVVELSTKDFPEGIIQFTLFDPAFKPRCERLAFVKKRSALKIQVSTLQKNYAPQQKVELNIEVKNAQKDTVPAYLSVAVVDKEMVQNIAHHTNLLSELLLTSDLKGYIEDPNYYFKNNNNTTQQALDLLMMTQGWRRFTWQDVLSEKQLPPKIKLERGFTLSGRLTTLSGKPVSFGYVRIAAPSVELFQNVYTDDQGRFKFENLVLLNTTQISIHAFDEKMKPNVKIILDKQPTLKVTSLTNQPLTIVEETETASYLRNREKQTQLLNALGLNTNNIVMLEEVKVTAKKIRGRQYERRKEMLYQQPSFRLRFDSTHAETSAITDFLTYISGRIPGLTLKRVGMPPRRVVVYRGSDLTMDGSIQEPMYLLNGVPVALSTIADLQLSQIAFVDILSLAQSRIYGSGATHGVLAVYLKKNTMVKRRSKPGKMTITYSEGYHKARQFYVPPYGNEDYKKRQIPDFRSTIYWNPYVKVKNGKAKVSFYNADAASNYQVIVEGISTEGELGRVEYTYEVKDKE